MIPEYYSIIGPIIGGIIASVTGLIVSKYNQNHQERIEERRRKWEKLQQKKEIRSRLLGEVGLMINMCYQRDCSRIYKNMHELIVNKRSPYIETAPEKSYDAGPCWRTSSKDEIKEIISEYKKIAEKEMDYAKKYGLEFEFVLKDLYILIGDIQVSFDNNIDKRDKLLDELDTALSDYHRIKLNPSEIECINPSEWSEDKQKEIGKHLDDKIGPAFENLLIFLKDDIDKDKEDIEKMDRPINHRCYRICKFFCNP